MDEIKNDVLNAVESYLWRWCVHCPDAKHSVDDITGPEEWWCMRKGVEPGGEGCRNKKRLALIEEKAREIAELIGEEAV